ncbi:hypothetical protein N0V82_004258 [Gnomoniopsis sp. IMI 355080]|nr:hypothetical protein N0V82_004258 [Gnomoniopsis sp. IMI 355080]
MAAAQTESELPRYPEAQGKPPAGPPPSLPQSAVSPPCPTGVDSHQDSTEPTNTGPDTARSENSARGWPQSRLRPVTAALEPSTKKVVKPVVIHSTETPPQQQQQHPLAVSSLLLPVDEADETQTPSADDTCTEPGPAPSHRERRGTAWTTAPVITPVAARTGRSAALRIINANATPATANSSSPLAPRSEVGTESSRFHTPSSRPRPRRTSSWNYTTPTSNPPARRSFSLDSNASPSPLLSRASKSANTNEWTPAEQEHLLPKAVKLSLSNENNKPFPRRTSSASRPPTSYKPLPSGYASSARIPPIRSFSLPGVRKSYPPDMNYPSSRYYDEGDDGDDQDRQFRERSLRALEGRYTNDRARDVAHPGPDDDVTESENNTADIFMNIAREDSSTSIPRRQTNRGSDDEKSTVSRVVRTTRTPRARPLSVYSSTQKPQSPPLVSRRLSDQQVPTSRTTRRAPEELSEQQQVNRDATNQTSSIGRPSLKLDSARGPSRVPSLKPSPITPRTQSVLDNSADRNSIFARRPSTRTGEGHSRTSSIKQPSGLSKSFNSASLVSKSGISHQTPNSQYVEASESSNSTAAPSTVWDELDELKSRIHRLELTGKMPKTSSAAISRTPEDRPPTAGTGATTLSGSPKRAQTEVVSMASSQQKETQSNLRSILSKTKPFVSSDVYDAIEAAANDALSLSQLMGTAGQPGPISSGASTIGVGGPSTVTDRQLRKKADSICRSLTELCIALKEEDPERKPASASRPQTRGTSRSGRDDVPSSPPAMRVFNGTGPDEPMSSIEDYSSPRVTRLDKRATFNFTGMNGASNEPSPRYASSVVGGGDDNTMTGRKSSLVLARARRGVTEEPEDQGRKTSLLRTRRTASEEPEDQEGGRRSSMNFAPRRVTTIGRVSNIDEEPQMQSRAPSRAFTEVSHARMEGANGLRINVPTRDSIARRNLAQEPASASSALPRTRLITSGLPTPGPYSSRLMTPTTPGGRRFLQVNRQQGQDENHTSNLTGRLAEERGQRYSIAGPVTTEVARGPSLHRKRHSGIPSISGTASNVGGYRGL